MEEPRKPLPNISIPTVRVRDQDVDETGNLKYSVRNAPINELAAIHIQRFLDDRNMRREYNVITDEIAAARDQLTYVSVLTSHLLKLEQAKREAAERGDPEREDLGKLYDEVKKALDIARFMAEKAQKEQPVGAHAVIESRKREADNQQRMVEATEKSATFLERMFGLERKRETERDRTFAEKGSRRKRYRDDDDDYDIEEPKKDHSHGLIGTLLGLNLLKGIFTPGDPRQTETGSKGIWGMMGKYSPLVAFAARFYLTAGEIATGWITADRMAVSKGTSILSTILGGAEKDETWMEKWLNLPVLGLGYYGAKHGARFGILGMLAGGIIGASIGFAMRALGPDRWGTALANLFDDITRWIDRITGSEFRLNPEKLRVEVERLQKGITLIEKEQQTQMGVITDLQMQLAKAQEERNASEIARLEERLRIERADLERLRNTEINHYKRIQQARSDFEETMMRKRDAELESLIKSGYDVYGKDRHLAEDLERRYQQKIQEDYEQNKEIYDTADKVVGNPHYRSWQPLKMPAPQPAPGTSNRPDLLPDASVNRHRTIETPWQRILREKEEMRKRQELEGKPIDPNMLDKTSQLMPPQTQRMMKADTTIQQVQKTSAVTGGGNTSVVAPAVSRSSTTNIANNQTSVYHATQPYLINDRMDRLMQLGWA